MMVGASAIIAVTSLLAKALGRDVAGDALHPFQVTAGRFGFAFALVLALSLWLRPRLVGRDTQMHDLMILFSTLGGILVFGALGFIIGPIIAALFQASWELFGQAYQDLLPPAEPPPADDGADAVVVSEAEARVLITDDTPSLSDLGF